MKTRQVKNYRAELVCCLSLAFCLLAGCNNPAKNELSKELEQERVTSPSRELDAVLIREDGGGAAGGWEWYVYIVAKRKLVDTQHSRPIFNAGTLTDGKLVWAQEHLLEIRYDIAYINQFKNIWGSSEIRNTGSGGDREYLVEIRLAPSSQDFSLLNPSGAFRPKK